jgi:hypothetical protein
MNCGWTLNVIGLVLATIAAVLMSFFPPRVRLYTEKGESFTQWTSDAKEEKRSLGMWQARLSKSGPVLLVVGFVLQLIAAFVSG